MRSLGMRFYFLLILTIPPQCPSAQYLGLDPSFGDLGVNLSWSEENHISDSTDEDLDNYEEKDKPGEMLSLETLLEDFAEMDNVSKEFEKDESSQESQSNMTLDGDVKIVLPRLKKVQQFINTKSNESQIQSLIEDTLGKWVEEVAGEVGDNLGLKESVDELKEVVDGIKQSLKHLVDEVGAKNKETVDELISIQAKNTNKEELFGKLVQRLVKAVDGVKEKSSSIEKVNSTPPSATPPPSLLFHKLY